MGSPRLCPCGCEKELGWSERRLAKRVRELDNLSRDLEENVLPVYEQSSFGSPNLETFIETGREFRDGVLAVIHGVDARTVNRSHMHKWLQVAAKMCRYASGEQLLHSSDAGRSRGLT